jgi:HEAT repeat protein
MMRRTTALALAVTIASAPYARGASTGDEGRGELARALERGDVNAAFDAMERLARARGRDAASALVEAFASPNAWIRRGALRALCAAGGARAVEVCVRALDDQDALVRLEACALASRLAADETTRSSVAAALARRLDDRRKGVRAEAAAALGVLGDARSIAALEAAARSDPAPRVRATAVRALGRIGGPVCALAARDLLEGDDDDRVREAAAVSLAWMAPAFAADAVEKALRDMSGRVRVAAAASLGQLGTPAAASALGRALALNDSDVQVAAVRALRRADTAESRAVVRRALGHQSSAVRREAAHALGHLYDTEAFAALERLVGDSEPSVRAAAVDAVGRFADPRCADAIRVGLTDRSPEVRTRAAEAAGRCGEAGSLQHLAGLARAVFSEAERTAAIAAIGFIGDARAEKLLAMLLNDKSEQVRRAAASALAHLGLGGDAVLAHSGAFTGDARVDFLGALALLRVERARKTFEEELKSVPKGSPAWFASHAGLYLLGDAARRRVVWDGARGALQGANPALALTALILAKDKDARALVGEILEKAQPGLRESAALALGVARPAWAAPLLEKAAAQPHPGLALRARVSKRWLALRGPRE